MLWLLSIPPCFLHSMQCFLAQGASPLWDVLGMQELIDSILHFSSAPFNLIGLGAWYQLGIVLDIPQDYEEGFSTDRSGILHQIVLGLPDIDQISTHCSLQILQEKGVQ